ncbi:AAA family ATPase [Thermodesulfobacteriota bacterium]
MAIITISRGSYSKGKEIAEKVAARLGYDCISREVILDASAHFNIPEIRLVKAIHNAPSILDRFSHTKQAFISYYQNALSLRVQKDNVVYHGLAGHLLLKGISHVLKIRIIAALSTRVKYEMEREGISEQEALALIQKDDQERRRWTESLYGVDPWDSSLYDFVIRIDKFTVENAVDFICQATAFEQFKTSKGSQQKTDDLVLASQVKAVLTDQHFDVAVTCEYGNLIIFTKADDRHIHKLEQRAKTLESEIEGINNIEVHVCVSYPNDVI